MNWFTLHRVANRSVLFRVLTTARCTPFVKKEDLKVTESLSLKTEVQSTGSQRNICHRLAKEQRELGLDTSKLCIHWMDFKAASSPSKPCSWNCDAVFLWYIYIYIHCYIVIKIVVIDQLFSFLVACRLAHPTSWRLKYWIQNTTAKENIEQFELAWWSFVSCPFPSIETIRNHSLHMVLESQGMLRHAENTGNIQKLSPSSLEPWIGRQDSSIMTIEKFPMCIFRPFLLLTMKLSQAWNDSDQSQPFCIAWAQIEIGASRL